jgi:hypothetical protein
MIAHSCPDALSRRLVPVCQQRNYIQKQQLLLLFLFFFLLLLFFFFFLPPLLPPPFLQYWDLNSGPHSRYLLS